MTDPFATPAEQFARDGFYIVPDVVIPESLVSRCLRGMDELFAGRFDTEHQPLRFWSGRSEKTLKKIDQAHLGDSALLELASHPAIGEWAAKVTASKVIQVWASQLFHKPAGGGHLGNVGWHCDQQYWQFWDGEVFTAWVALTDVDEKAGALRFIRGSHRWPTTEVGDALDQDLDRQLVRIAAPDGEAKEQVIVEIPRGGVSFHQSRILHASGPNFSQNPRRSIALHLRTEKAQLVPGREHYGLCEHLTDFRLSPVIYAGGGA